jgi:hypothetical protein
MNKAILEDVALWLEAGAPHVGDVLGFNLSVGVKARYDHETNTCGTVCCIAGAIVQFNEPVLKREELKEWVDNIPWGETGNEYGYGTVFRRASRLAEISECQALELFEPSMDRSEVLPEQAAKVVRHFMETGAVDWDIIKKTGGDE